MKFNKFLCCEKSVTNEHSIDVTAFVEWVLQSLVNFWVK